MPSGLICLVMVGALGPVGAFHIKHLDQSENQVAAGGVLRLSCTSNSYFEYCSWSHSPGNRECHLEWKRMKNDVIMQDCHSELKHRVSVQGTYSSHECAIEISGFEARDAGQWTCQMEQYVLGGKRGSGTRDSRAFNVGLLTTTTTTSTTPSTPSTTSSTIESSPPTTPATITPRSLTEMTDRTEPNIESSSTTLPDIEEADSTEHDRREEETRELSSPDEEDEEDLEGERRNVTEMFVQSDEETAGSGSTIGIICGVALVVLAAGAVAAVFGWKRRQNRVQTITMSKLIEEGEVRGSLLEENEFNTPEVDRVLLNSLP